MNVIGDPTSRYTMHFASNFGTLHSQETVQNGGFWVGVSDGNQVAVQTKNGSEFLSTKGVAYVGLSSFCKAKTGQVSH